MSETVAQRFARDYGSMQADRKAREWDNQPVERRHRSYVNENGSFQD